MKRLFTLCASFLLSVTAYATPLNINAYGVSVSTCDHDAGAICSVIWNGKQFIDDYDHGRQLQSAVSFDGLGEAYNPTEAGMAVPYNGVNPSASSSLLLNQSTLSSPPTIKTANRMAYWRPVNGNSVSNWIHSKNVELRNGPYAAYMKYDVQFGAMSGEPSHSSGTFEALTGYMPPSFSIFYTLDVKGSRQLASIGYCTQFATCSPEQPLPLIFATSDGNYAMGIYNRTLPQSNYPAAGFGRWNYAATSGEQVVKWNTVFRYTNIQTGVTYYFTNYVVVGTLNNVKAQMQWLYDNGY